MNDERTARSGRDAITVTFTDVRARLARVIRRIVGANSVEDIVQETFLKAYEAAGRQVIHHPRSFILATARNLALNHIARADNKLTDNVGGLSDLDAYIRVDTVPMDVDFDSRERLFAFCRAVQKLPLQCRRVFILKRVYGLSQKDIAKRLGISENTVEKQAGKGLAMCAQLMKAMGHPVNEVRRRQSKAGLRRGARE
jgi:RNA polymerase sigma-70 factor (ECF subfamily)